MGAASHHILLRFAQRLCLWLVLMLGVGCSILCIVHCQVIDPLEVLAGDDYRGSQSWFVCALSHRPASGTSSPVVAQLHVVFEYLLPATLMAIPWLVWVNSLSFAVFRYQRLGDAPPSPPPRWLVGGRMLVAFL